MKLFETKLKLKSFRDLSPHPQATPERGRVLINDEGLPRAEKKPDEWLETQTGQLVRIVRDNRVGNEKRIYRIELWDKNRRDRVAVFDRRTSSVRQ